MSKLREYIAYEIEHSEALIASVKKDPGYVELPNEHEWPHFSRVIRFARIIAFEQGRMAGLERLRIQCKDELADADRVHHPQR
jgi:hypothetical protein